MNTTTILVRFDASRFLTDPSRCVIFNLFDENDQAIPAASVDDLKSLDNDRLTGIMIGLDCMKALFDKLVANRNIQNAQLAEELTSIVGEQVNYQPIERALPTGALRNSSI